MSDKQISANEALQNAILYALTQMLERSRREHKNIDNIVLREIKGIHSNTEKGDLPEHLRKSLNESTISAMGYIRSAGYAIVSNDPKGK